MACPSELMLEEFLMDGTCAAIGDHVAACVGCTQRLAEMRRLSGEFRRIVYPDTAPAVLDSVARPYSLPMLLRWLSAPTLAAAAVASILLFVGRAPIDLSAPDQNYVGTKGEQIVLTVFARTLDGA